MEQNGLDRFLAAQEWTYPLAYREITQGRKRTHWIWYIFPQLRGLGYSRNSVKYGIADLAEARAYLAHPILSSRLREITEALLVLDGDDPVRIFGEVDAAKVRSSMTLFCVASEGEALFREVLRRYYGGEQDPLTLSLLRGER